MTRLAYILASLRHHWRVHLGTLAGATAASAVLLGALAVGDSTRATLREIALARVGRIDLALHSGDRFFRTELADTLARSLGGDPRHSPIVAPALLLAGSASLPDGSSRANRIQILGVDSRFRALAPNPAAAELPVGQDQGERVAISSPLARRLGARVGDRVTIRMEKPGVLSRDAPLSGERDSTVALLATVSAILTDEGFGRFGLRATQLPPLNAFVDLRRLQERLSLVGRANLLALGGDPRQPIDPGRARGALADAWQLADAGVELRPVHPPGELELRSSRIFLEPEIERAARACDARATGALAYLVNELRAGERTAPYSFALAIEPGRTPMAPDGMADDEILVTRWLADTLGTRRGDTLSLAYWIVGHDNRLAERTRAFRVRDILPMTPPALDPSWMPKLPGLSDADDCRDWEPGLPIDLDRIRPEDERYWDEHRGAPKAFLPLATGQAMWANRFGALTSIRFPAGDPDPRALAARLRDEIEPERLGLRLEPTREQALAATDAPVDFGQLFAGFSFFLLAAAGALTGMLFAFSLLRRAPEIGLLLAVGLRPRAVRRLLLTEGFLVALAGALLGIPGALLYTGLLLAGLGAAWREAAGGLSIGFHVEPLTLCLGTLAALALSSLAQWLSARALFRQTARALLAGEIAPAPHTPRAIDRASRRATLAALALATLAAGALARFGGGSAMERSIAFFGAGTLLLAAALCLCAAWLRRASSHAAPLADLAALARRNVARRPGRSMATVGVFASGIFLALASGAFRKPVDPLRASADPGTGGFTHIGESAMPIYEDLDTARGREAYGIDEETMRDTRVVRFRVRPGDDASCLNMNRALTPRLLGVDPATLDRQSTFQIAMRRRGAPRDAGWQRLLTAPEPDGAIPALIDEATLLWALGLSLGDTIEFQDERHRTFRVRPVAALQGSILQGDLLIDENRFLEIHPSAAGYAMFLVRTPPGREDPVARALSRALADRGLELVPTGRRLVELNAVENAYLAIFQALGGLGLLLGSAGLAAVVGRNLLERRPEFALLEAVGIQPRARRKLLFLEHRHLIAWGTGAGSVTALVSIAPGFLADPAGFPLAGLLALLAALILSCVLWTWLASRAALARSNLDALRLE